MKRQIKSTNTNENYEEIVTSYLFSCIKTACTNSIIAKHNEIKMQLSNGNFLHIRIYDTKENK